MSDQPTPGGFMGGPPPGAPAPAQMPNYQPAPAPAMVPLAEAVTQMSQPPTPKPAGYFRYVLPSSVKNSTEWTGSDADLIFGLREPTAGELKGMAASETAFDEAAFNYVVMVGDVRLPDYTEAMAWKSRLNMKARTLVVSEFVKMFVPTEAEGESMHASRQWVG